MLTYVEVCVILLSSAMYFIVMDAASDFYTQVRSPPTPHTTVPPVATLRNALREIKHEDVGTNQYLFLDAKLQDVYQSVPKYKRSLQTWLRYMSVCGVDWRAKFAKGRWTHQTNCSLAHILDVSGRVKKREDQLRGTTRDLRTRVTKWTEVDGGILEYVVQCNRFVI